MEVLFQWLLNFWSQLVPFFYLDPDERGVQWRSLPEAAQLPWIKQAAPDGVWVWDIGPGIHFKIPFIDDYGKLVVKPRNLDIDNISAETSDRVGMMISLNLKFWVSNPRRAILETEDFERSLVCDAQNIVVEWLESQTYEGLKSQTLVRECFPLIQKAAPEWGCRMRSIGVNSMIKHRTYRLLTT